MNRSALRLALIPVGMAVIALAGSIALRAQAQPAQPDVLPALLAEVRGLRVAIEQMTSAGARAQVLLGRVQLQEQRIANQVRRLDAVRAALVPAQRQLDEIARRVKEFELTPSSTCDPGSPCQTQREFELKMLKRESGVTQAEVQRLLSEESFLVQDIATEQARWSDFNQRLEELDRALARR
jgi:hypothetical protein